MERAPQPSLARITARLLLASALGGVAFLAASSQPASAEFVCDSPAGLPGGEDSAMAGGGSNVACGTSADATGTDGINTAFGNSADASGDDAANTAIGHLANASGFQSINTAIGRLANASGNNGSANTAAGRQANASGGVSRNIAMGLLANASGEVSSNIAIGWDSDASGGGGSNIAIGLLANASGAGTQNTQNIAVGVLSRATGNNAIALGNGTKALHANSAAFGRAAGTERPDQQVFGTETNTYTMRGIASDASLAVQGPVHGLVTTDTSGNLASDGGALQSKVNANMMGVQNNAAAIGNLESRLDRNDRRTDDALEGVALSLAMAGTFLPQPGESVRLSGNWGNFEGSNAVAFSGAMALGTQTFLTAGLGVGLEEDTVGGRAGVSYGW